MATLINPSIYVLCVVADVESIPYSLISILNINIIRITERKTHSNSKDVRSCRFLILQPFLFSVCIYFEVLCSTPFIRLHSEFRSVFIPQMSQFRILVRHPCSVLTLFSGTSLLASQPNTLCLRPHTTEVL